MRSIVLVLVFALGLGVSSVSQAKAPPSFALWVAKWKGMTDQQDQKLGDGCIALYSETANRKVGECFVKGEVAIIKRDKPIWEKAIGQVSRGQTPACRRAIHAYWLASRKSQAASNIYLASHPHRDITDIQADLQQEPYPTLKSATEAAKKHAVEVCG